MNLIKSVLAGLGMSIISFLAMPVAGFREAGFPGLIAGGLSGTLYAALFTLMGVANGAWQMIRGAVETPMAVRAARHGMLWDVSTEQWKPYNLQAEYEELQAVALTGSVKDDSFYRLLEVHIRATSGEIKRAYYRKARSIHPDKNSSQEAADQFRQLHAVYLVLVDDEKRAAYDRWGPQQPTDIPIPLFDPYVFYGILFHSSIVDKYVGALTVASFTDQLLKLARAKAEPGDCLQAILKSGLTSPRARRRQVEIARNLQERIKEYTNSNREHFQESCRTEALQIAASGPFGNKYLTAIGSALVLEANAYLGFQKSVVAGVLGMVRRNARSYRSFFSIAQEVLSLFKTMMKMSGETVRQQIDETILPQVIDAAWAYNEKDIHKTLQAACMKLFADVGDKKDRTDRANAIRLLGEVFLEIALTQATKPNDELMSRVAIAFKIASEEVSAGCNLH